MRVPAAVVAVAMSLSFPAAAQTARSGDITLSGPQIRASIGRARASAGYLTIRNTGMQPDQLYFVSCACAEKVEMHTHQMAGGVGKMVRLPSIIVPAGGQVTLAPGGVHLMFMGLKERLAKGDDQKVTLTFAKAGRITTTFAVVTRVGAPAAPSHHHPR
ncbi:MAG TPA: copper chaperone PCu(A)C [Caulobacteraceae bacterium]|jgi:hypothetical protein